MWGELSLGEFSLGLVVLGRVVFGASCPDPLYGNENFCNLGFYMGKCDNDGFFGNYFI